MDREEVIALFEKYEHGLATDDERLRLERWYHLELARQRLPETEMDFFFLKEAIWKGTLWRAGLAKNDAKTKRIRPWLRYAAAIIFLALGIGIYFYVADGNSGGKGVMHYAAADIAPGGNRATLTLADGRTVELSEAQSGIVVDDGDIRYSDGSDLGFVIADPEPVEGQANNPLTTYDLQLTTPKGGTYQVTLPDGSRVWLNADSKLRYPSRFDGKERIVELEGEAYFDVSHQLPTVGNRQTRTMPFIVATPRQKVQVLGTEFNISAYTDEPDTKTTLVSGAIQVASYAGSTPILSPLGGARDGNSVGRGRYSILKPGQQSIISEVGIQVKTVDITTATAWKNGRFSFEGKSFEQVMRELARWYNIDVRYEGTIPQVEFYGDAFRDRNLSIVLRMLESAELHYRVEGNTLVIVQKGKEASK
ncbi:FecR family protein [Olivibacter sitiensis]|uniref:FecR family protein n=1 Tax=Olivibacter sitiensis TaxID=376470 RepID=UPI000416A64E|nr:FecR family protein [Olivibacter sitiensis]